METQNELDLGIGSKELKSLQPAVVKIVNVEVKKVGAKENKKLVCSCIHPNKEESIDISSTKYQKHDKLMTSGLWLNLDEDKLIRKGSPLAIFMEKMNITAMKDLKDKEVETVLDEKGFLAFKSF